MTNNFTLKILILICSGFFLYSPLVSQPQPCGQNAVMQAFCSDACVICDIDGFNGRNDGPASQIAPDEFCSQGDQRVTWIAFIAGSTNLTLEVDVFNCQGGNGLQIGILQSLNCNNYKRVTNCERSVSPGETVTFTNIVPLNIGEHYYFCMDGDLGDVCSYSVRVISGSTAVPPLSVPSIINGPETLYCENLLTEYTIEADPGARFFDWTLNREFYSQGPKIELSLPTQGVYELCVQAYNACDIVDPVCKTINLVNDPLLVSFELSDYNGYNVSCYDSRDGRCELFPTGGVAPYSISWDSGKTISNVMELDAGFHKYTVTDASGCIVEDQIFLTQPEEIFHDIDIVDTGCSNPQVGRISLQAFGGVEPYLFSINDEPFTTNDAFVYLETGLYQLRIRDFNDCFAIIDTEIKSVPLPDISFPIRDTTIELGELIDLNMISNSGTNLQITYSPASAFSCQNCLDPVFTPVTNDYYVVEAVNELGCIDKDSIYISISKDRLFYVPTAFSPNGDGINDYLEIYSGKEVKEILYFKIYTKWGGLVFDSSGMDSSGGSALGWDGKVNGQDPNSSIFVWQTEILFIDNQSFNFSGEFTLLR